MTKEEMDKKFNEFINDLEEDFAETERVFMDTLVFGHGFIEVYTEDGKLVSKRIPPTDERWEQLVRKAANELL